MNVRFASPRRLSVLSLFLLIGLSGCAKTPHEAIQGRWYNGEMSLRFRPNGTVVWNTQQGLAQGKYQLVGDVPRWAVEDAVVQVRLDVTRNGQVIHPTLNLRFVGSDRIQVSQTNQLPARTINRAQAVLRRATSDSEKVVANRISATRPVPTAVGTQSY